MYLISNKLFFEDYLRGQEKINFWVPPDFNPKKPEELADTPPEIAVEEERKMKALVESLTLKVFEVYDVIVLDENQDLYVLNGNIKKLLGNIEEGDGNRKQDFPL